LPERRAAPPENGDLGRGSKKEKIQDLEHRKGVKKGTTKGEGKKTRSARTKQRNEC